jgi:hypothetical protein
VSELWPAVDRLIDSAPGLEDLRVHRLQLLAARRWGALGRPVPRELMAEMRWAGVVALTTPLVLEKVRAACDGPVVLIKGVEVAARYPEPTLRPCTDIDVLVPKPAEVEAAMIDAGFVPVGHEELVDSHHLQPLQYPGLPLYVEVHSTPKWPAALVPPPMEELVEAAVPSAVGVDGILSPRPVHHTLVLAAHAWAHEPLGTLSQLIDVVAVAEEADRGELRNVAASWQLTKVWATTCAAADALLLRSEYDTLPLRLWARHLRNARQRTVLETHAARLLSPFWGLRFPVALGASLEALIGELRPAPGESWGRKIRRIGLAVRHASVARPVHDRKLDEARLSAPTYLEQVHRRQENRR